MESLKRQSYRSEDGDTETWGERAKHMHKSQECSLGLVNPGLDFEGV